MGLWQSKADDLPALQRLQRVCCVGGDEKDARGTPAEGLAKGEWGLPKRHAELAKLGTKDDFLRSGGICAAVTLLLSSPRDAAAHAFALRLILSAEPTAEQVALAWRPLLAALAQFPGDSAVQEAAAALCLRASTWEPLAAEVEPVLPLLHRATDALLATPQPDVGVAAAAGLCAELLAALTTRRGAASDGLQWLWHKGLGLAARRMRPQDTVALLEQLRGTIDDPKAPPDWVRTSLSTLRCLYSTMQVDAYDADAEMLCRVLQEAGRAGAGEDAATAVAALHALAAMAKAPSVPAHPTAFLVVVRDIAATRPCEEVGRAAAALLQRWVDDAMPPLVPCSAAVALVLQELLLIPSQAVVEDAAGLAHRILTDPARAPLAHGNVAGLVTAAAGVEPRFFAPLIPLVAQWPEKAESLLSPQDAAVLVSSLCAFCGDAARTAALSADAAVSRYASEPVCAALGVLAMWAAEQREFARAQLREVVACALRVAERHAPLYDRAAARVVVEAVHPRRPRAAAGAAAPAAGAAPAREVDPALASPEVWAAVVAVFAREQSYWLPDRELLSMLLALGTDGGLFDGKGDAFSAALPDEFRRGADAFRESAVGRRVGVAVCDAVLLAARPDAARASYHLQPSTAQALYNWAWGGR